MSKRATVAAPRRAKESEDEGLERAQLCIRVMERFFAATNANPKMEPLYLDLLDAYMDTLQDELSRYAFDLAYALFSDDEAAKQWRK